MAETKTDQKLANSIFDTHIIHAQPNALRPYPVIVMKMSADIADAPHPPHYKDVAVDDNLVITRVKIAASRSGGWAWAASKIKKDGICVEIGVDHGDGIERWLTGEPAVVIGVDPWLSLEWDSWFSQSQKQMDARHAMVVNRFKDKPVSIVRETSDGFFSKLPSDFRADWWFIDGDHREEPCYKDICSALKFSNHGAWIFCDDIDCGKWAEPIGNALKRFMAEHGDEVELVWDKSSPVAIRVK